MKKHLTPEFWFFVLVWLTLAIIGREKLLQDDDTIWHSVVGEQILQTGQFPWTDEYSFTFNGKNGLLISGWANPCWQLRGGVPDGPAFLVWQVEFSPGWPHCCSGDAEVEEAMQFLRSFSSQSFS